MIDTLNELKRRSLALGLCGEYKGMWDGCTSRKDLYDLATDINGLEYIADVCTFGWGGGFGTEYIKERFQDLVNGAYTREKDGYTTSLYVGFDGVVQARSTAMCLLGCKATVMVPFGKYVTLYIGADSDVTIINLGKIAEIKVFGDSKVNKPRNVEKTTTISESQWKRA